MPRRRRNGLRGPAARAELERQEATRALLKTLPVERVERDGETFRLIRLPPDPLLAARAAVGPITPHSMTPW